MKLNPLPFQYALRGNRLAALNGQMLAATHEQRDRDLEDYLGTIEARLISFTQRSYRWQNLTTATDPGSGFLGLDNAPATATSLRVSPYDKNATVVVLLGEVVADDLVVLYDSGDVTHNVKYRVTGPAVDSGGWFTVPVVVIAFNGFAPGPNANVEIAIGSRMKVP